MKKVLSMVLAAMMLLSLCSFAAAEDVVELEFVYHKTESNAIDAMETADALVLASPVHYAGISGAMSAFCDRLFYASGGWANKPCACVVSARRAGTTAALDQLVKYPMISNMPVVSSQYWPMVHGACAEQVAQDEEGLQTMRQLARNLLWLVQCIAAGDAAGVARPETEARTFTNFIR